MATDMLEYKLFDAKDIIFKEGDAPENAYLIHMGAVEVVVGHSDGSTKIIDTLNPGEFFGEMALVDNLPRSATAIAKVPTTCAMVSKEHFESLLDQAEPLTRAMLELLVKRLRKATQVLDTDLK